MSIRPDGSLSEVPPGTRGRRDARSLWTPTAAMPGMAAAPFSGKDPTKVDRSASYAARYVAKNIVAAGLADRCEVQVAYAIGVARPVSVLIDTAGTAVVPEEEITRAVLRHVDLRPLLSSAGLTSAARSTVRLPPTVTWDGRIRTRRGKRGIGAHPAERPAVICGEPPRRFPEGKCRSRLIYCLRGEGDIWVK